VNWRGIDAEKGHNNGFCRCWNLKSAALPGAKPPRDPATKKPVEKARERIEQLIDDLEAAKDRVIIPAPALSEFLVLAGNEGPQYLNELTLLSHVYIQPSIRWLPWS